jgi:hypothetical protein
MLDEKTVDKIDKMCTNNVQMEFFSLKAEWNSSDLWEHLKRRYFLIEWSFKWAVFNSLKMLTYESFIADLKSKILNILIELKSQNLIIEQIVTLKVLNIDKFENDEWKRLWRSSRLITFSRFRRQTKDLLFLFITIIDDRRVKLWSFADFNVRT